ACRGCRVLQAEEKAEDLAGAVLDAAEAAEMRKALALVAGMEPGQQDAIPAYIATVRRIARAALERVEGGSDGGR
ncbi:MAG: hypothetical protein AB1816_17085, partial [Bacillota bacterium]